ncbi:unnamed protein product [Blepharisma stoltei]|uniref:Protein kinase domain-containing protein n=1 Tax=Blepharisma stoltei TaxID=1481888 RepID=A0AAU9KJG0_9CILI|nr:unnamed protein product [Blepharisma stoltei]
MLSSIFSKVESLTESHFWSPHENHDREDLGEIVYQGTLSRQNPSGGLRLETYYLTSKKLIYFQNSNGLTKYSNLSWKVIEPFVEEEASRRYGFCISYGKKCKYFYTKSSDDLDKWLNHLSFSAIMTDIENDYLFQKQIGTGSFAAVYLAKDLDSKKSFAIKSINKVVIQRNKRNLDQIIREIEIMRQIDHPNIAKLYKIYESETHVHLVLEYVAGGTLLQRLTTKGPFSEEKSAKFIEKFLKVLRYLCQNNIVHRDIKPENILMTDENKDTSFKLIDFGLACVYTGNLTSSCGSPGYVAPEILRKIPYDPKVDVFSAGIILYIILSGRAPFSAGSPKETLVKNRECFITFSEKYWGNVSRQAINVVLRLTQPNPLLRPTAKEALAYEWFRWKSNENMLLKSTPTSFSGVWSNLPTNPSPVDTSKKGLSSNRSVRMFPFLGEKNRISMKKFNNPKLAKKISMDLRREIETPKIKVKIHS